MRSNMWLVLLLALCRIAQAADTPQLADNPIIRVDRLTGAAKDAIYFRNDSAADLPLSLSATVNCSNKECHTQVLLAASADGPGLPTLNWVLKHSREAQPIWVFVTEAWDSGDTEVVLSDKEAKIGKIVLRRLPVNIKLDGATPDSADLSLTDGVPARIFLRNGGPDVYKVDWKLIIDSQDVCHGDNLEIRPYDLGMLTCTPSIPGGFSQLVKDDSYSGSLLVGDRNFTSPFKIFPVKAAAYNLPDKYRHLWGYLIIFVVLVLGGFFSILLSQTVPNLLLRMNLQEQILGLAKTTSDLTTRLDSQLAVQVRIERTRIGDLLRSRWPISPDYANLLSDVQNRLVKLRTRIHLLEQIDGLIGQKEKLVPRGAPPCLVEKFRASLDRATVLLVKADPSDKDNVDAQAAVSAAETVLNQMTESGPDFGTELLQRMKGLKQALDVVYVNNSCFKDICQAVPGPWDTLQNVAAGAAIPPDLYVPADLTIAKLKLMRDFASLLKNARDPAKERLKGHEERLISLLQLDSLPALQSAALLIREMKEDVYPERLRHALEEQEAFIDVNPSVAYDRAALAFSLCFHYDPVNTAAAREEWICQWDFGDGFPIVHGWDVSHYFELRSLPPNRPEPQQEGWNWPWPPLRPGEANVTVTFLNENGKPVLRSGTKEVIKVSMKLPVRTTRGPRSRGRNLAESLKLAALLLVAVFGLVSGARDQLAKLDVLPGLVAVFLVGFGADTIKNLLTSKPAEAPAGTAK